MALADKLDRASYQPWPMAALPPMREMQTYCALYRSLSVVHYGAECPRSGSFLPAWYTAADYTSLKVTVAWLLASTMSFSIRAGVGMSWSWYGESEDGEASLPRSGCVRDSVTPTVSFLYIAVVPLRWL